MTSAPLNPFIAELPEKLNFRRPDEWKCWLTRWEGYRVISGLKKQDGETQVNSLVYAIYQSGGRLDLAKAN